MPRMGQKAGGRRSFLLALTGAVVGAAGCLETAGQIVQRGEQLPFEFREVEHAFDYQRQNSRVLHCGLGTEAAVDRPEVAWPDGSEHTHTDLDPNRRVPVFPNAAIEAVPA